MESPQEVHVCMHRFGMCNHSDRNNRGMGMGLVLVEGAKSLAPSNVIGHGKILYQKPRLKSMAHGIYIYPGIAQCISKMLGAIST